MTSFMQIHCVMCSNILLYFFGRAFHWIAISITSVLSDLFYLNISTKVIVATENSGCPAPYYRSWEYFRPLAGVYLRGVWRQGRPEWLLGRGSPPPGGGEGAGLWWAAQGLYSRTWAKIWVGFQISCLHNVEVIPRYLYLFNELMPYLWLHCSC